MNDDKTTGGAAGQQAGDQGLEPLAEELAAANKQIQDLTETAKRALADLQNYRKRAEEEKAQFVAFATSSLVMELVSIVDNFNRAFAHVPDDVRKTDWFKGALQIEQQFVGILRKQGVKEMESQLGKKLDLNIHEPILSSPGEKDVVLEEFEKGYMLGDKVLRPAKVKVGNGVIS